MLKLRGLPAMGRPLFFCPIRYCHPACGSSREGQPIPPRGVCNGAAHDVFVFAVCGDCARLAWRRRSVWNDHARLARPFHSVWNDYATLAQRRHSVRNDHATLARPFHSVRRDYATLAQRRRSVWNDHATLGGLFTVCSVTMQHLHSVVTVCEMITQAFPKTFW